MRGQGSRGSVPSPTERTEFAGCKQMLSGMAMHKLNMRRRVKNPRREGTIFLQFSFNRKRGTVPCSQSSLCALEGV